MKDSLNPKAQQESRRARLDLKAFLAALKNMPRRTLALWLVATLLGLFLLPLTLYASSLSDQTNSLQTDLTGAIAAETSLPTLQPQVASLVKQLDAKQIQAKQIQAVMPTLAAGKLELARVMPVIGNYDSSEIALDGAKWSGAQLTVTGHAVDNAAVLDYVTTLEQSGMFKSVSLQSVQIQDPQVVTMTVAPGLILPTATMTSTATVTPTPSLVDVFEPDDIQAPPLYLGVLQTHSFYPVGDVDRVTFLAKAGRYYHISTSNLAPGVDTLLRVDINGQTYTNDDFVTGAVYSELDFSAPGQDMLAMITITNRGQFGPAQTYGLQIQEIGPTATPTMAPVSSLPGANQTAAPTATLQPTNTVQPTVNASPTLYVPPTVFMSPTPFAPTAAPTDTPLPPTATSTPTPVPPTPLPSATPMPTFTPTDVPTVPPTPSFSIVNAQVGVTPQTGSTCPGTFTFSGTLTSAGAGTATFVWERSDGTTSAPQAVTFGDSGTLNVSDTWSISGTAGFNFNGSEQLHVLSPNSLVSNQAPFMLVCLPDANPTPGAMNTNALPLYVMNFLTTRNELAVLGNNLPGWLNALRVGRTLVQTVRGPAGHLPSYAQAPKPTPTPQQALSAQTNTTLPIRFVIIIEMRTGTP